MLTAGAAVTVGRGRAGVRTSLLTAPADPLAVLADLLDLYDLGTSEPLPLGPKVSEGYAARRGSGEDHDAAVDGVARDWEGGQFPGENADRHHVHVWGSAAPLSAWTAAPPGPDEQWPGETTRFGVLARRFWAPLLAAEVTS